MSLIIKLFGPKETQAGRLLLVIPLVTKSRTEVVADQYVVHVFGFAASEGGVILHLSVPRLLLYRTGPRVSYRRSSPSGHDVGG